MKRLLFIFACVVGSCFGQIEVDKAYLGAWSMDVPKSKFPAGIVPPKSALLIVSEHGYVATQQGGTNAPPVFAVALVGGKCYLIGPFPPMTSCATNMDNPKRPIISIKEGDKETRRAEVQLAGETMTVKTTIIASPGGGPGGEELVVFTRTAMPVPPSKK